MIGRLEWMDSALCAQTDPPLFFPEKGGSWAVRAKRICQGCLVLDQCREYSLTTMQPHGIWGGLSVTDREKILGIRFSGPRRTAA